MALKYTIVVEIFIIIFNIINISLYYYIHYHHHHYNFQFNYYDQILLSLESVENIHEIKLQPVALDFKNFLYYSSRT